jgi:hypothetical protein
MTLYHCGYKSNELACIKEQLKSVNLQLTLSALILRSSVKSLKVRNDS